MECKNLTAIELQMQQTIDQLRANAKGHKKTVDKLSAKVSQLTQQRDDATTQLSLKEQEAAFYKTELDMRGYKTFNVGGHAAMSIPTEREGKATVASAFAFVGCSFALGFFAGMGWFVFEMAVGVALK